MSVRIQFDQPSSRCYTNLDFVTGRVTLILPTDATIAAINVKLEAESRTRLAGPKDPRNERSDKKRLELEVHKVRILSGADMIACRLIPIASCFTKSKMCFPDQSCPKIQAILNIPFWQANMSILSNSSFHSTTIARETLASSEI